MNLCPEAAKAQSIKAQIQPKNQWMLERHSSQVLKTAVKYPPVKNRTNEIDVAVVKLET